VSNASAQSTRPELTARLKDLLGPAGFIDRHQAAERQTSFWNSEPLQGLALVRPKSTEEVSAILALCHKSGQPVRVIGGGTGPVAVPDCQTLALSFERMAAVAWCRQEQSCSQCIRHLPLTVRFSRSI
jgi:FAD/FMN-containing dehydrogenase